MKMNMKIKHFESSPHLLPRMPHVQHPIGRVRLPAVHDAAGVVAELEGLEVLAAVDLLLALLNHRGQHAEV